MKSVFPKNNNLNEPLPLLHSAVAVSKHIKSGKITNDEMRQRCDNLSCRCPENVTDNKFYDEKKDYLEHTGVITIENVPQRWFHLGSDHFRKDKKDAIKTPEPNVAITSRILKEEALFWFKNLGWTLSERLVQLGEDFQGNWEDSSVDAIYSFVLHAAQARSVIMAHGSVTEVYPTDPKWVLRDTYVNELMSKVKRTQGDEEQVMYTEIWLRSMNHKNLKALLEFATGEFEGLIKIAQYNPLPEEPKTRMTDAVLDLSYLSSMPDSSLPNPASSSSTSTGSKTQNDGMEDGTE